ncbi:hypothetical protein [Streptomyces acidicola]
MRGRWEAVFLVVAATAAVLAVVRPDLYAGLAQRAAAEIARIPH